MVSRPRAWFTGAAIILLVSGCAGSAPLPSATIARGATMQLTSDAFRNNARIPTRYTCDGDDTSPPLTISDVPTGTKSLTLVVEDPDAPGGTWYHWVAFDIPVITAIPGAVTTLGTAGTNSWGRTGYGGPCPPRGSHRYFFILTALDTELGIGAGSDQAAVRNAMDGHVLATATLIGHYSH